jgi:hypothetical protein
VQVVTAYRAIRQAIGDRKGPDQLRRAVCTSTREGLLLRGERPEPVPRKGEPKDLTAIEARLRQLARAAGEEERRLRHRLAVAVLADITPAAPPAASVGVGAASYPREGRTGPSERCKWMSPVSRRRRKKPSKKGRAVRPSRADGPTLTPDYSQARRTVFGPESPPEVKLLTALCDVWQQLAQGVPANHCFHAVCAIKSALAEWDVESEPLTVTALVKWPNPEVELGAARPSWQSKRNWSGHLGLWVPGLGRFVDPTLIRPTGPTRRPRSPAG